MGMLTSLVKLWVDSPKKKFVYIEEASKANPTTPQQLVVMLLLLKKTRDRVTET